MTQVPARPVEGSVGRSLLSLCGRWWAYLPPSIYTRVSTETRIQTCHTRTVNLSAVRPSKRHGSPGCRQRSGFDSLTGLLPSTAICRWRRIDPVERGTRRPRDRAPYSANHHRYTIHTIHSRPLRRSASWLSERETVVNWITSSFVEGHEANTTSPSAGAPFNYHPHGRGLLPPGTTR